MYHSIGDNNAYFTVTKEAFGRQMQYIKDNGYNIIFISELIDKMKKSEQFKNTVCITFDDGYKDNFEIAYPILKELGIKATFFIATQNINKTMRTSDGVEISLMKNSELAELAQDKDVAELMPHTAHHVVLDKVSFEIAASEISESRKYIESLTLAKADIFAYPKGRYTDAIIDYLRDNEWSGAVTVEGGLIKTHDDIFKLKRNSIDSKTSFIQFKTKLSNAISIYEGLKNGKTR